MLSVISRTGIVEYFAISSGIMLECSGSRCDTTTNPKPVSGGVCVKNFWNASSPPADAPRATMQQRCLRVPCGRSGRVPAFVRFLPPPVVLIEGMVSFLGRRSISSSCRRVCRGVSRSAGLRLRRPTARRCRARADERLPASDLFHCDPPGPLLPPAPSPRAA